MAIDNSDKAWAGVIRLRARAQILLGVFIISFFIGVLLVVSSVGIMFTYLGSSSGGPAVVATSFGVILLSIASTSAIGWFFAVSMANHAEVVYFSSASNKERTEILIPDSYGSRGNTSMPKPTSGVVQTAAVKCPDCGVQNDDDQTYCRVCGGYLN